MIIMIIRQSTTKLLAWHRHFSSIVDWCVSGPISPEVASFFGAGLLPGAEDSGSGVAGYEPPCVDRTCVLAAGRLFRPHPTPSLPSLGGGPRFFLPMFLSKSSPLRPPDGLLRPVFLTELPDGVVFPCPVTEIVSLAPWE